MNCLDFRRAALADPAAPEAAFVEHARDCAACAAFLAGQRQVTQRLKSIMRVTAAPSLADRVIFAHAASSRRARRWPALAAASAFAALVLGALAYQPVTLASQVSQHIEGERLEEDAPDPKAVAEFPELVAQLGGVARASLPLLQAAYCETPDHRPGLHLVLADRGRTVTLFVLPHDAPRVRVPVTAGALHGWVVSHRGVGVAVLSEGDVDPSRYLEMMDAAIAWPEA